MKMRIANLIRIVLTDFTVEQLSTGLLDLCAQVKKEHMNNANQTMNARTICIVGMHLQLTV
jgi:hypothetical protein